MLLVGKCEVYILFGFTIYLMYLTAYLKRKKSKKKKLQYAYTDKQPSVIHSYSMESNTDKIIFSQMMIH